MDPSEFEDTVEKSANAINAGALEELFQGPKKFSPLDLKDDIHNLYLHIYNLQDFVNKLPSILIESSVEKTLNVVDDFALKMTDMKEDYLGRRKKLIAQVKRFSHKYHLDQVHKASSPTPDTVSSEENIASDCKELIDMFKVEYEFLSLFNKHSEQSFITLYKLSPLMSEMCTMLQDLLPALLQQQEVLKRSQEQLQIAAQTIYPEGNSAEEDTQTSSGHHAVDVSNHANHSTHSTHNNSALTSSISLQDFVHSSAHSMPSAHRLSFEQLLHKCQEDKEREKSELKQHYLNEMTTLKAKLDMESRQREGNLQLKYEEKQVAVVNQYETLIQNKEEQLQSLLQQFSQLQQQSMQIQELEVMKEYERKKREQLEEKYHQTMLELTEAQQSLHQRSKDLDVLQQVQLTQQQQSDQQIQQLHHELMTLREKCKQQEGMLASRPPVDLQGFLEKTGLAKTLDCSAPSADRISWKWMEQALSEYIRKLDHELVNNRLKEQEFIQEISSLQREQQDLAKRLKQKEEEANSLEKDLWLAHEAIQQSRNKHVGAGGIHGSARKTPRPSRYQDVTEDKEASKDSNTTAGNVQRTLFAVEHNKHVKSHKEIPNMSYEAMDRLLLDDVDQEGDFQLLQGKDDSSNQHMLLVMQHQRDRYMKSARDLEEELSSMKIKHDRLQDEQLQLRNENLELYRRLRVLRVSTGSSMVNKVEGRGGGRKSVAADSQGRLHDDEESTSFASNGGDSMMDMIDRKYNQIYEQEMLSPFRIAELEKQQYLSRMNTVDRFMALLYRYVMQDSWARHAFLIYLMLVHLFALFYVFQVLNPQLVDEVDAHLKAKWSTETLGMPEHPDV